MNDLNDRAVEEPDGGTGFDDEDKALMRGWILLFIFVGALFWLLLGIAVNRCYAHDATPTAAMPNGWSYPYSCCSSYDCREAKPAEITERAEGFVVGSTGEIVPYGDKRVRVSPDGRFHWCAHQEGPDAGRTICLFAPPRSY